MRYVDPSGHDPSIAACTDTNGINWGYNTATGIPNVFLYPVLDFFGLVDPVPAMGAPAILPAILAAAEQATATPAANSEGLKLPTLPLIAGTSGIAAAAGAIALGSNPVGWGVVGGVVGGVAVGAGIGWLVKRFTSKSESSDDSLNVDQADEGNDTIQTGGNTVKPGTAEKLNDYSGKEKTRGEWGDALEKLKGEEHVPNNDHGKIKRGGDYYDGKGQYIGNLNDYL